MSLLQKATGVLDTVATDLSSASSSSTTPITFTSTASAPITINTDRIIIILSRDLTSSEMSAFTIHGKAFQYSPSLLNGATDLKSFSFNYLMFDVNNSADKTFLSQIIHNNQDYVVIISKDSSDESWIKTLCEGNYVSNIITSVPPAVLNKQAFDNMLLNTIHLPHRRSLCEKIRDQITPSCLSGIGSGLANVIGTAGAKVGISI